MEMEIVKRLTASARRTRMEHNVRVATQRHRRIRDQREGSNVGLKAEPNEAGARKQNNPLREKKARGEFSRNKANSSL